MPISGNLCDLIKRIGLLHAAEMEMVAAVQYYESCAPGLGRRFSDQVIKTIEAVAVNPKLGRLFRGEVRRHLVQVFPFAILYVPAGDEITVVAVMDLRHAPDYWLGRY